MGDSRLSDTRSTPFMSNVYIQYTLAERTHRQYATLTPPAWLSVSCLLPCSRERCRHAKLQWPRCHCGGKLWVELPLPHRIDGRVVEEGRRFEHDDFAHVPSAIDDSFEHDGSTDTRFDHHRRINGAHILDLVD